MNLPNQQVENNSVAVGLGSSFFYIFRQPARKQQEFVKQKLDLTTEWEECLYTNIVQTFGIDPRYRCYMMEWA